LPLFTISPISLGLLENRTFRKGNINAIENKEKTTDSMLKMMFHIAYRQ
jgi:hypothetical protein